MDNVAANESLARRSREAARQVGFEETRALYEAGNYVREIARKLGLGCRCVERWVRRIDFPELNVMVSKFCTPAYFEAFLAWWT